MDGLFGLIWMAFIVVTIVNSINKKNKKAQKRGQTPVPPFTAQPVNPQPVQPRKPAAPKPVQTKMPLESMLPPQPVRSAAAPKVHPHLALDCDLDDPTGSMDFISTEGMDPCHDDNLPGRNMPRATFPVIQEQPGLTLEWSGDALVRSVIMQEVLTRPSQRRRPGQA